MAIKHVSGDWEFPAEFGFTGSTKYNDNARPHRQDPAHDEAPDPYSESYADRQTARHGGRIKKASGGDIQSETLNAPGQSFKQAFAAARKQAMSGGPKTFTWNGKSYNTNLAPSTTTKSTTAKTYPTVAEDSTFFPSSTAPGQDIATGTIRHSDSEPTGNSDAGPGRKPSGNKSPPPPSGPGRSPSGAKPLPTPPIPPDYYDFSVTGQEAEDRNAQVDALRRAQGDDNTLRRGGRVKKAMGGPMPGQAPQAPAQAAAMGSMPMASQQGMQPGMPQRLPQQGMPVGAAQTAPGPAAMARGGSADPMSNATISMPVHDAKRMAQGLVGVGRAAGARQAVGTLANAARARLAQQQQQGALAPPTAMAKGGHLDAAARHALTKSDFALPGERYPIPDASHARNALARVSGNGTPSEKATVRSAVHRKFPGIGKK